MVCTVMGMKSVGLPIRRNQGEIGAGEGLVNFACHQCHCLTASRWVEAVSLVPRMPAREIQRNVVML